MHKLTQSIAEEIVATGPITFARFMERALYDPIGGYYSQPKRPLGKRGDFYTSVSVGKVFGELLACQCARWLEAWPGGSENPAFTVLEAGAHDGQLAADILHWLRQWRPQLFRSIRYTIVEPLPARTQAQQERLAEFQGQMDWRQDLPPPGSLDGVIISNELLDAFPVHRISWSARDRIWWEWGVAWREEQFAWERLGPWTGPDPFESLSTSEGVEAGEMETLRGVLPEGYFVEMGLAARNWWQAAAQALRRGWLCALDYGFDHPLDQWRPERLAGTLRAYREHRVCSEILADPGAQDLTAHVDFVALKAIGERVGLRSNPIVGQAQFLAQIMAAQPGTGWAADWTPAQCRQVQTLIHPDHLGRAFRVLIQQRE